MAWMVSPPIDLQEKTTHPCGPAGPRGLYQGPGWSISLWFFIPPESWARAGRSLPSTPRLAGPGSAPKPGERPGWWTPTENHTPAPQAHTLRPSSHSLLQTPGAPGGGPDKSTTAEGEQRLRTHTKGVETLARTPTAATPWASPSKSLSFNLPPVKWG